MVFNSFKSLDAQRAEQHQPVPCRAAPDPASNLPRPGERGRLRPARPGARAGCHAVPTGAGGPATARPRGRGPRAGGR